MGIETKEKTIGDVTYRVSQTPSGPARKLLVRLFKVLGPSIAEMVGTDEAPKSEITKGSIASAIRMLAMQIEEQDLEAAIDVMFGGNRCSMSVDGGEKWPVLDKGKMELHFAGKTHELLQLVGFGLEVNYSGFSAHSGGVEGLLARAAKASSPSKSPETSTGPSTES